MLHPRENAELIGHAQAEETLLAAAAGKMPHAWLITGPKGIGKATLAYRFARYILCGEKAAVTEEPESFSLFGDALPEVKASASLKVAETDPVFSQIAQGSHGNFTVVEPTYFDEEGKERASLEMRIYQIRDLNSFFGHTAAQDSYRIVLIDSADDMNRNASNALLKLLEEPPARTIFLLISHQPGRLLPTIRSRCRVLKLAPLEDLDVGKVLAQVAGKSSTDNEMLFAARFSDGSPGLALQLYEQSAQGIYAELVDVLSRAKLDFNELLRFTDRFNTKDGMERWQAAIYLLRMLIQRAVKYQITGLDGMKLEPGEAQLFAKLDAHYSVDQLFVMWEKVGQVASHAEGLNMDRAQAGMQLLAQFEQA